MRYLIYFSLFLAPILLFSQSNEDELLKNHHTLFTSIKSDMDAMTTNESRIAYLDSVKASQNSKYVVQRIDLLRANTYRNLDLKKTYDILHSTEAYISKNPEYNDLQIHYDITLGRALYDSGEYNQSLKYYSKAEKELKGFADKDDLWDYFMKSKTGIISNYVSLNRNKEAIDLLTELEKTVSPDDQLDEYIYVLNMLGYLHTKSKNYEEGVNYFLEITKRLKNKDTHKETYFTAVNNLGYIYKITNKLNDAITLLVEAIAQAKKYQIVNKELLLSNNLGYLYLDKGDLDNAEVLGLTSIEKSKDSFEEIKAEAERLLAVVNYRKDNPKKALTYAESAAVFFRKINDLNRLKYVLGIKNKILIKTENFEEATKVNSEMISLMDSISLKTDMQNLQKTLVEFETEKKDSEITILKQKEELASVKLAQQRDQILFLIGLLVVLLILGAIIFIYHKKLGRIQNLALRSKLTRSQFNPHYINNAFTALQAELAEHNFNEKLINYTSSISRFSRLLLESTFKDEWTINEEKTMIENYLSIQQHRLENGFQYHITSNMDHQDLYNTKIPSAITQTVLENAIEHGGFSTNNKIGKIEVEITKLKNQLCINIKNNILNTIENTVDEHSENPSRGLQITRQRVALHSKLYNKEADFSFTKNEHEAEVIFKLPVLAA